MNTNDDWSALVNNCIDINHVVQFYLKERIRNGRIPCPFHNGRDSNLGLYKNHYKCYVCGNKGTSVTFVMNLFDETRANAVKRLNRDFALGLPIEGQHSLKERLWAKKRLQEFIQRSERKRHEIEELTSIWFASFSEWLGLAQWCDADIERYAKGKPTVCHDLGYLLMLRDLAKERMSIAQQELIDRRRQYDSR